MLAARLGVDDVAGMLVANTRVWQSATLSAQQTQQQQSETHAHIIASTHCCTQLHMRLDASACVTLVHEHSLADDASSAASLSYATHAIDLTHVVLSASIIQMRYIAAYLLAVLGGKENPSANDVSKILSSVGVEIDSERLNKVIEELEGKDVNKIIAAGSKKLAKFGGGGGAAPAGGAAAGGAAAAEVVEEKEEEEEADLGGGMDMFGGGADY